MSQALQLAGKVFGLALNIALCREAARCEDNAQLSVHQIAARAPKLPERASKRSSYTGLWVAGLRVPLHTRPALSP